MKQDNREEKDIDELPCRGSNPLGYLVVRDVVLGIKVRDNVVR
jgi:hypothetical protein